MFMFMLVFMLMFMFIQGNHQALGKVLLGLLLLKKA